MTLKLKQNQQLSFKDRQDLFLSMTQGELLNEIYEEMKKNPSLQSIEPFDPPEMKLENPWESPIQENEKKLHLSSHRNQPYGVEPDIIIKSHEGWFDIRLCEDNIPTLTIDPEFVKTARSAGIKEKSFFDKQIKNAKEIITLLSYRQRTLQKVCKVIFEFQLDFLLKGPNYISSLTLKEVADSLCLDHNIVSLVVKNKYIQKEDRIYPLNCFFTSSGTDVFSGNPDYSKIEVMLRIKRILDRMESQVSDSEIIRELMAKGIMIDKQTVNKYRNRVLSEWN